VSNSEAWLEAHPDAGRPARERRRRRGSRSRNGKGNRNGSSGSSSQSIRRSLHRRARHASAPPRRGPDRSDQARSRISS
jgi:hypothetical protein